MNVITTTGTMWGLSTLNLQLINPFLPKGLQITYPSAEHPQIRLLSKLLSHPSLQFPLNKVIALPFHRGRLVFSVG